MSHSIVNDTVTENVFIDLGDDVTVDFVAGCCSSVRFIHDRFCQRGSLTVIEDDNKLIARKRSEEVKAMIAIEILHF